MNVIERISIAESIDRDDLLSRCMGNQQFAQKILAAFLEQLDRDLIDLDEALSGEDLAQVATVSHRVKGAASNVSARRVREIAATLEELAKVGTDASIADWRDALHEERDQFADASKHL